MNMKLFLTAALAGAMFTAALTGCSDNMPGDGTVGEGSYEARAEKYAFGETPIDGLYATLIRFYFENSKDPNDYLFFDITLFHGSPEFGPGTYTFPSTGALTASGTASVSGGTGGTIRSGSITVAETGGKYRYTFTAKDVVYGYSETETATTNFTYRGDVPNAAFPPDDPAPMPEFGGMSTIAETVSGRTIPRGMALYVQYMGVSEETGLHCNMIWLSSEPMDGGTIFEAQINLYSEARDLTSGTYTAARETGAEAGTFDGGVGFQYSDGTLERIGNPAGEIVVEESGGVYTVRLDSVAGETYDGQKMTFDGAYTGPCYGFVDGSK